MSHHRLLCHHSVILFGSVICVGISRGLAVFGPRYLEGGGLPASSICSGDAEKRGLGAHHNFFRTCLQCLAQCLALALGSANKATLASISSFLPSLARDQVVFPRLNAHVPLQHLLGARITTRTPPPSVLLVLAYEALFVLRVLGLKLPLRLLELLLRQNVASVLIGHQGGCAVLACGPRDPMRLNFDQCYALNNCFSHCRIT